MGSEEEGDKSQAPGAEEVIRTAASKRPKSRSAYAIPEKKKYPLDSLARARNAIARVQQHGTPEEKRRVFAAIRRRYPALARRSNVIPTRTGPGRRYGQPPKTKAGGSSVAGTVRRKKRRRRRRKA